MLRLAHIGFTLILLGFFALCWLYYAKRNLIALFQQVEHCLVNSLKQFAHLLWHILFSFHLVRELWRTSIPKHYRHGIQHWLVPVWWMLLVAANTCKILAAVLLAHALTVEDWFQGYQWMLAAYGLYIPLYLLTSRLARQLARYQKIQWQHLTLQHSQT